LGVEKPQFSPICGPKIDTLEASHSVMWGKSGNLKQ